MIDAISNGIFPYWYGTKWEFYGFTRKSIKGVMKETLKTKNALTDLSYRVIGKLMSDKMIIKWITNKSY